jgi:hypothetical protein
MHNQTQIGIGATALFALISLLMITDKPLLGWRVGGTLMAFCALVALWGFWPIVSPKSLASIWRVPLRNALQICFEASQSSVVGPFVSAEYDTEHERFSFMLSSLQAHRVPMFGREQGSRIAREVPQAVMRNLRLVEGTSNLARFAGREGVSEYLDVYVRRPDLWRHARYLKKVRRLEDL